MGKRSKSVTTASNNKRVKNKKIKFEDNDTNDESKLDESITIPEDKQVKINSKNKSQINAGDDAKKNEKIIFNDEEELVEVESHTVKSKRTNQAEVPQENEEDIKDEDIDKFCDELNEEDNEQYESWVKLIEAKLGSNKKKPK